MGGVVKGELAERLGGEIGGENSSQAAKNFKKWGWGQRRLKDETSARRGLEDIWP